MLPLRYGVVIFMAWRPFFEFWAKGFILGFVLPGYLILFGFLFWIFLRLAFVGLRVLNSRSSFADASTGFVKGIAQLIVLGMVANWFFGRGDKD